MPISAHDVTCNRCKYTFAFAEGKWRVEWVKSKASKNTSLEVPELHYSCPKCGAESIM